MLIDLESTLIGLIKPNARTSFLMNHTKHLRKDKSQESSRTVMNIVNRRERLLPMW
jgi:ribosomal protein S15P/S13E